MTPHTDSTTCISFEDCPAYLRQSSLTFLATLPVACKPAKTYAQQLLESDQDDELFALIADEVREPTWLTPILCEFPAVPAPERSITSSPMSTMSTLSSHSRSSSSSSSSGFTFSSVESGDSYSSSSSTISQSSCAASPSAEKPKAKLSRRERARQARVYVDGSKNQVTNYDGGKTTVLTGLAAVVSPIGAVSGAVEAAGTTAPLDAQPAVNGSRRRARWETAAQRPSAEIGTGRLGVAAPGEEKRRSPDGDGTNPTLTWRSVFSHGDSFTPRESALDEVKEAAARRAARESTGPTMRAAAMTRGPSSLGPGPSQWGCQAGSSIHGW